MRDWADVAEGYRRSFARACAGAIGPLLAATNDQRGHSDDIVHHLDVGCGDGRLAAAASETARAVVACDADATMCELTRCSAPDVATLKAALPELPFCSGSFDIVTANFVINHVGAPCASMRELSRVCRRDGIVAATIWPAGGAGFGRLLREVLSLPDLTPLPDQSLPADQDFERTRRGLGSLFAAAGLDDVRSTDISWTWTVTPEDLWAGITAGVATPGMTYLAQSPEVRARMRELFFETARTMSAEGTLTFDARAVLATGRIS